ncbi:MAG: GAF domain-containing protein [Nitrospinae bacterium]|nr:GAF domain-containing protein [Nitrospinota bacterium]
MDDKLSKVNLLGQFLAASRSEEEALEMAMVISRDVLGYDHAILRLLTGDRLLSRKWIGFPREAAELVIRVGEGISGEAARTGQTILVEDTTHDPRFLTGVENCRSELCVPLRYNDRVVGVINVESDLPAYFTQLDVTLLETLAAQIATAMETQRLREALGRAEKLMVVGNMASSILHDIRNDIHRLNIAADLLERGGDDRERTIRVAAMVRRSGENIYSLIEDIFEFVKTGTTTLSRSTTPLGGLLLPVAEFARSLAPETVEVTAAGPMEAEINVDARRFGRALVNLARNAVEAMPDGGKLALTAFEREGKLLVTVADTGVGIDADKLEKIWEPLYTYGKAHGTGLGMAIVKKIVTDHGCAIDVASVPGQGTTFTLDLSPLQVIPSSPVVK